MMAKKAKTFSYQEANWGHEVIDAVSDANVDEAREFLNRNMSFTDADWNQQVYGPARRYTETGLMDLVEVYIIDEFTCLVANTYRYSKTWDVEYFPSNIPYVFGYWIENGPVIIVARLTKL